MPAFDPGRRRVENRRLTLIVPGSIETSTGGYEYDRRIAAGLRAREWTVDVRSATPGALRAIPDGAIVVVDGLALDSVGAELVRESTRLRLIALVHMPGASATDERAPLAAARLIVVTGGGARLALAADGIDPSRIRMVQPGTEPAAVSMGSGDGADVALLSVGNVTAGKGHDRLVRALESIGPRNWRLTIVGSLTRDTAAAMLVERSIRQTGLADRITVTGTLDGEAIENAYDRADVFVLATLHETYGMAIAEAIARGLPVVSTDTGEIAAITGEGGIIVRPGDTTALAAALESVVGSAELRARLRAGAVRARARLRGWDRAVDEFVSVLDQVSPDV